MKIRIQLTLFCIFLLAICVAQPKIKSDPLEDSIAFYQAKKQHSKVVLFAEAWCIKVKKRKGTKSEEFGTALQTLGDGYRRNGQTKEAERLLLQSLEIRKNIFGENHPAVASSYISLGNLFVRIGNYPQAEVYYLKSLEIRRKVLGENHLDVAATHYSLGNLYTRQGNYTDAESHYLKSLEIGRKAKGEDDISLADTYNALGALANEQGNYADAERHFLKAIGIWKSGLGEDHLDIANTYNNLGNLYERIGNYPKAEFYFLKSLEIWKLNFGENHPDVADSYNNLGVMCLETKNFKKSELYFLKSVEIKQKLLSESDPEMAVSYFNLGNFYYMTGNLQKARIKYLEALEKYKVILREDHPDVADVYNNLASVYLRMGLYLEAEQYFQKSLRIFKRTLGEDHTYIATSYSRLGLLNINMGNLDKAESYYQLFQQKEQDLLTRYFPFLSEAEKEKYLEKETPYLEVYKSFCVLRYASNPSIASDLYNQQLARKAILVNSSTKWRQRIKSSDDQEVNRLFEDWNHSQNQLNQLLQSSDSTERAGIDSVQSKTEKMEKELSLRSENFARFAERKPVLWQEIQKKLNPGEAAVEMIRIQKFGVSNTFTDTTDPLKPRYSEMGLTDTIFYAALIVKPGLEHPEMVLLENGNDLEDRFYKQYKKAIRRRIPDIESYLQFWGKIGARLAGTRTVYLSPDGVYHKINLNTFQNPKSQAYLLDEKDIRIVTVTKDLVSSQKTEAQNKQACLVGFPKYDLGKLAVQQADSTPKINPSRVNGFNLKSIGNLGELPATKPEIEKIGKLLRGMGWDVTDFTGELALEENVKEVFKPRLLHVATHGFFQSDSTHIGNPLLRSGLMLTGAIGGLQGQKDKSGEDGILTSAEAMNLNLDNTDLVVLSACETGLGEIKNGEGVYGLQRAFKVAGAKSIIMSLWKVDDVATQELMVSFYKHWLGPQSGPLNPPKGDLKPPHQKISGSATVKSPPSGGWGAKRSAFLKAQKELKAKYPNPYYWGAFVMVGE